MTNDSLMLRMLGFLGLAAMCHSQTLRTVPLGGSATLGFYYVNLFIGERNQKQSLIVDTGSSLTTFPCKGCSECGTRHYNSPYDPPINGNLNYVTTSDHYLDWKCQFGSTEDCPFSVNYVEGSSYTGRYVAELVVLEDELSKFNRETDSAVRNQKYLGIVGCLEKETGHVREQEADGLLGLGLNTNCKKLNSKISILKSS